MTSCSILNGNWKPCTNEATASRKTPAGQYPVCDIHDLAGGFVAAGTPATSTLLDPRS